MKKKKKSNAELPSVREMKGILADKPLTDLEDFQAQYGDEWRRLTAMPVFRAGLQLLNVRALDALANLGPEDIEKYSVPILATLIGQLKHENDIFNLHEKKDFKFPVEDQEEYLSPEQAAELEQTIAKMREQTRRARYG